MTNHRNQSRFSNKNGSINRNAVENYTRHSSDSKINKMRRLINEDTRTLRDPFASQEDKIEALANREANRRQVPPETRERRDIRNGMNNLLPADRRPFEDEMNSQPSSAHGYPTSPGSYQQFQSYEVTTTPNAITRNGNITNFGYPSEMGDRAKKMERAIRVQDVLRQNLDRKTLDYVNGVTTALKRQVASGNATPQKAFERYEITSKGVYTEEALALIGLQMGVLTEKYESTAGKWVVTMPFKNPQDKEQVYYNLHGMDGENGAVLEKKQTGNYFMQTQDAQNQKPGSQLPPAKEDGEDDGLKYYRSGNQKSRRSLQNPKRGDDFIRHSRIQNAMAEERRDQAWVDAEAKRLQPLVEKYVGQLESEHSWIREGAMKGLQRIKSQLTSMKAEKDIRKKKRADALADEAAPASYAEGLSRLLDTKAREQVIAEQSHARHLNLLEEAKRILSNPQSGSNLLT